MNKKRATKIISCIRPRWKMLLSVQNYFWQWSVIIKLNLRLIRFSFLFYFCCYGKIFYTASRIHNAGFLSELRRFGKKKIFLSSELPNFFSTHFQSWGVCWSTCAPSSTPSPRPRPPGWSAPCWTSSWTWRPPRARRSTCAWSASSGPRRRRGPSSDRRWRSAAGFVLCYRLESSGQAAAENWNHLTFGSFLRSNVKEIFI